MAPRDDRSHAGPDWSFADLEFSLAADQCGVAHFHTGYISNGVEFSRSAIERDAKIARANRFLLWWRRLDQLARVKGRVYDLIVCDLKMPRVDGMTFYRTLERDHPDAARRIMFVTGDVAGTEAEQFLEETGCRWLAKPFRLRDLIRIAREIAG